MAIYLVTGGAGFIGSHLVRTLLAQGKTVRILDNFSTGHLHNLEDVAGQIELIKGDVRNQRAVGRAVEGVEVIFHQAALASVPRSVAEPLITHDHCVTGTVMLLDAARRAKVQRFVYAASSSAYGDTQFGSKRETDLPMPLSPYAASKLAGELYCQAFYKTYGLETVGLRYFNVFGPRQDPASPYSAVIPLFIAKLLAGQEPLIFGDGLQSRDFTYVDNVVHANLCAATAAQAPGRTFNIATGRSVSLLHILKHLQQLLGTSQQPQFHPARIGDVRDSLADISQAQRILGYSPQVDLEEGLRRSVDFYRTSRHAADAPRAN
jgi:UDP-glucose 4-epimerase